MALYMYQCAYTPESLAAQMKDPQDRLATMAKAVVEAAGCKMVTGGFSFGEYDLLIIYEAPDDVSAAALSVVFSSGGALKSAKTTNLLSGPQWVETLRKASSLASVYRPAR